VDWSDCYKHMLPYVFAIETPEGSGSGVFFMYNEARTLGAVATAAHVVEHADESKLPIKLRQHSTGKEILLQFGERVVLVDHRHDSASILFPVAEFQLPVEVLPIIAADKFMPIGVEVGWVGYPSIALPHLCFFSGRVSAFLMGEDSYLIDGVAIKGVSGGPVFSLLKKNQPQLLGTISAYMPSRIRGDALPGLLRAQDFSPFHKTITTIRDLDEARKKQEEETAKMLLEQQESEAAPDVPAADA